MEMNELRRDMSILDDTNVTVAHGELRDLLGTGSSSHDTTKSQRSSKDGRTTSMANSANDFPFSAIFRSILQTGLYTGWSRVQNYPKRPCSERERPES